MIPRFQRGRRLAGIVVLEPVDAGPPGRIGGDRDAAVLVALKPEVVGADGEALEGDAAGIRWDNRTVGGEQGNRDLRADVVGNGETSR